MGSLDVCMANEQGWSRDVFEAIHPRLLMLVDWPKFRSNQALCW